MDEDETFETGNTVSLPDGVHRGIIKDVHGEQTENKATGEVYKYLQLEITPEAQPEMNLRYGCPLPDGRPITPASKLGRLLMAFGLQVPGPSYTIKNMRDALEGKTVRFQTMNAPAKKGGGSFANVVEDSIKPSR